MSDTNAPEAPAVPAVSFDPEEAHEVASAAAITTFRHHPGAWMDALPAALDTYRTVFDGLAKPPHLERS